MENPEVLDLVIEFGGGAEFLFGNIKKHEVQLVQENSTKWTVRNLLRWIEKNLLKERPELFIQDDSVRPGILVLINDADWELLKGLTFIEVTKKCNKDCWKYNLRNHSKDSRINMLEAKDFKQNTDNILTAAGTCSKERLENLKQTCTRLAESVEASVCYHQRTVTMTTYSKQQTILKSSSVFLISGRERFTGGIHFSDPEKVFREILWLGKYARLYKTETMMTLVNCYKIKAKGTQCLEGKNTIKTPKDHLKELPYFLEECE